MIVKSLEHLNSLSRKIADKLAKNDCIFLIGEIGVGKTTFTRYLINYLQEKRGEKITEVSNATKFPLSIIAMRSHISCASIR